MNHAVIIWWAIIGILVFGFMLRAAEHYYGHHHNPTPRSRRRHRHIMQTGSEGDILYVPGDLNENDAEEFDNL